MNASNPICKTTIADFEISALVKASTPMDAITVACLVRGKSVSNYTHLNAGQIAMCASNLLRTAVKKDPALLESIKLAFGAEPSSKAPEAAVTIPWASYTQRFQFCTISVDGDMKFSYKAPKIVPEGATVHQR